MWGGFRDRKMENALAEILYILNTQLACKQNDVSLKMGEKNIQKEPSNSLYSVLKAYQKKNLACNKRRQE